MKLVGEPPAISRADSSNVVDSMDPQPQLSKKFEMVVENSRLNRDSISTSNFKKAAVESDTQQLIQLDEVFSNIQISQVSLIFSYPLPCQ